MSIFFFCSSLYRGTGSSSLFFFLHPHNLFILSLSLSRSPRSSSKIYNILSSCHLIGASLSCFLRVGFDVLLGVRQFSFPSTLILFNRLGFCLPCSYPVVSHTLPIVLSMSIPIIYSSYLAILTLIYYFSAQFVA